MIPTRASLLLRIRDLHDRDAWRTFHELYAPLLYHYARKRGLHRDDAEEVRDQCFEVITRRIGGFAYDRTKGGFKSWLRRMAENKVVDLLRKRREPVADSQVLRAAPNSDPSPAEIWDQQWTREHLRFCVEQVRPNVSPDQYYAFRMLLFDQCPVTDVAARLGMNANQVYKAKSRVLQLVAERLTELEPGLNIRRPE